MGDLCRGRPIFASGPVGILTNAKDDLLAGWGPPALWGWCIHSGWEGAQGAGISTYHPSRILLATSAGKSTAPMESPDMLEKIWEGSNESNEIACCAAPDLFPRLLRLTRRGRNNFQYMKRSHRNSSFSWPLVRFPWGGTTARTQLGGHSTSSERRFNREG